MIQFSRESVGSVWGEAMALSGGHYAETGICNGKLPMKMDRDWYDRAEEAGSLRVYTARERGELAGYATWVLSNLPHHRGVCAAVNDVIYLRPQNRKGSTAMRWLKYMESSVHADGAAVIFAQSRTHVPALASVLNHLGYEAVEVTHVKLLETI